MLEKEATKNLKAQANKDQKKSSHAADLAFNENKDFELKE